VPPEVPEITSFWYTLEKNGIYATISNLSVSPYSP